MINILKIGNAIVIDFTDNDKYLHNGTIEVAPNELMVVIDGSDMATFKKMSNGDTLFGLLINLIQIQGEAVTKDNIIDKFGIIGFASGGGGAVDSVNGQTGEVVITAAGLGAISKTDADAAYASKEELASKADSSTVEALNTEIDNKQDTLVSGTNIKTINGETILGEGNLTISGGTQPRTWTFTTSSSLTTGDLVIITPSGFTASEWLSQVTNGDMVYLDKGQEYMKLSVSNIYHRTTGNSVVGLSFYSTRLYTISVVGISFRLNINRFPKGKTENGTSIGQNADVTDTDSYCHGVKAVDGTDFRGSRIYLSTTTLNLAPYSSCDYILEPQNILANCANVTEIKNFNSYGSHLPLETRLLLLSPIKTLVTIDEFCRTNKNIQGACNGEGSVTTTLGLLKNNPNLVSAELAFLELPITTLDSDEFDNCTKLENIWGIFRECTSLTNVPTFNGAKNITDFSYAFWGCTNLTGSTPVDENGYKLWERAGKPGYPSRIIGKGCFEGCTQLDDYDEIPWNWK